VTMCDVGGGSERFRDVTHVTSAAKPGQGVVDDSANIGAYRTLWFSTHGASDGE